MKASMGVMMPLLGAMAIETCFYARLNHDVCVQTKGGLEGTGKLRRCIGGDDFEGCVPIQLSICMFYTCSILQYILDDTRAWKDRVKDRNDPLNE